MSFCRLFFSLALGLKLSWSLCGRHTNGDVNLLWQEANLQNVKAPEWSRWLATQLCVSHNWTTFLLLRFEELLFHYSFLNVNIIFIFYYFRFLMFPTPSGKIRKFQTTNEKSDHLMCFQPIIWKKAEETKNFLFLILISRLQHTQLKTQNNMLLRCASCASSSYAVRSNLPRSTLTIGTRRRLFQHDFTISVGFSTRRVTFGSLAQVARCTKRPHLQVHSLNSSTTIRTISSSAPLLQETSGPVVGSAAGSVGSPANSGWAAKIREGLHHYWTGSRLLVAVPSAHSPYSNNLKSMAMAPC